MPPQPSHCLGITNSVCICCTKLPGPVPRQGLPSPSAERQAVDGGRALGTRCCKWRGAALQLLSLIHI
eukprot:11727429-Alexandrium_andersonii.AAC.1